MFSELGRRHSILTKIASFPANWPIKDLRQPFLFGIGGEIFFEEIFWLRLWKDNIWRGKIYILETKIAYFEFVFSWLSPKKTIYWWVLLRNSRKYWNWVINFVKKESGFIKKQDGGCMDWILEERNHWRRSRQKINRMILLRESSDKLINRWLPCGWGLLSRLPRAPW